MFLASDKQKEEDLFEGDILLTDRDKQLVDLRNDGDVDGPLETVSKRNAQRDQNYLLSCFRYVHITTF